MKGAPMNRLTQLTLYIFLAFTLFICQCNDKEQKKQTTQSLSSYEKETLAIMLESSKRSQKNLKAMLEQTKKLQQNAVIFDVRYKELMKLMALFDEIKRLEEQCRMAIELGDRPLVQKLESLLDILHQKAYLMMERLSQPSIELPKIRKKPNWPTPSLNNDDSEFPVQRPA